MKECNVKTGTQIGKAREAAGETQAELAAAFGINRVNVTYWENGERPVKYEYLIKIAKRYGVSADYLLGLSDAMTNNKDLQFVCDYTGLSTEAVEGLCGVRDFLKMDGINHIIGSFSFGLAYRMQRIQRATDKANMILSDFDQAADPQKEMISKLTAARTDIEISLYAFSEFCREIANSYDSRDSLARIDTALNRLLENHFDYSKEEDEHNGLNTED